MLIKYIYQLPVEMQKKIKAELLLNLAELKLSQEEFLNTLENAMNSRLGDLSDTININQYLDIAV